MTNWPVQKLTHRTTQKHVQDHDATDIKNYSFVFFGLCLRSLKTNYVMSHVFLRLLRGNYTYKRL